MSWAAAIDRANRMLVHPRVFGQAVVYTPRSTGVPEQLSGIFDESYRTWALENGTRVAVTGPALSFRLADLSVAPDVEDVLTVADRDWEVVGPPEPDGSGMVVLRIVEVG